MKDLQEKESIVGVRGRQKHPSRGIAVCHHSASLMMPDSDPRYGCFYLPLTSMIDSYITSLDKLARKRATPIVNGDFIHLKSLPSLFNPFMPNGLLP